MTSLKKLILIFSFTQIFSSCATTSKNQVGDLNDDSQDPVKIEMMTWIDKADRGEAATSLTNFQNFQQKNPLSVYMNFAKYGEAYSFEKTEKYKEALAVYSDLMKLSRSRWPKIYAQSLYRTSFIYENTGENVKLLAALQEAAGLEKDLPPEIVQAEIPARRSMVYAKMDQKVESEKYLAEADRGLRRVMEQVQMNPAWLAKIYLQMGSLSLEQMGDQNISSYIKAFQTTQRYLLNSVAQNDPEWSKQAATQLVTSYNTFWGRIENFGSQTQPVDLKQKQKNQFYLYADLMKVMNEALLLKPLVEQKYNDQQKKIYSFLDSLESKISKTLLTQFDHMPLTEESELLNSVQKPGQVLNPQPLPGERN